MGATSLTVSLEESRLPLTILSLAWPVVTEQTSATLVGLTNTVMVGHLGAAKLAAVGLGAQAIWLPQVMMSGVTIGATAVIARRIGEGRREETNGALHQSLLMVAVLGLVLAPLMWLCAEPIMLLLRAQGEAVSLGTSYIRAASPGLVSCMIMFAGNAAMRGAGRTRTPMVNMLITDTTNALLGFVFIYGFLGFTGMGVTGAGVAASCAWTLGAALAIIRLKRGVGPLRLQFGRALRFDRRTSGHILNVGFPAGIEMLQSQIAFTFFAVIVSSLGTIVYAAHMVALRLENLAFMPGFGIGVAATTLVGQALGAGRVDLAERAAKLARLYAMVMMTVVGVLMGVFRGPLMGIFVSDPAVIEMGSIAILIYVLSLPAMGTSGCLAGSLRGAGDTRAVMFIMIGSLWLIRLPFGYTFAHLLGFGAVGAWTAAVLDINARGLAFWWRFATGRWKAIRV